MHCNKFRYRIQVEVISLAQEWYTFSEASRLLNKNRNYFFNRYRLTPELFKKPNFQIIGGVKFINKKGILEVTGNLKKMVGQLKNRVFNWHDLFILHINKSFTTSLIILKIREN